MIKFFGKNIIENENEIFSTISDENNKEKKNKI